ncbi:hypothetical protein F53441_13053 [Fusarium austroafricanum]|uniref:Uncharacterized protein n=1 Tax=Fusarium austroafricanum TaxID=2364996 RepID=A0A8H4JTT5_9HYPO|nr:hypothetical protein F53441_13053 [Fusarium austroafricanum]
MPNLNHETLPWEDSYACGRGFVYEKPSPLRIVKCDNNGNRSTARGQTFQGDGSLAVAKKRKTSPERAAAEKENLGLLQHDQSLSAKGSRTLHEAKYRGHSGQAHASSSSAFNTLPAIYDLRRPVTARPPLTNIYGSTPIFNGEPPPSFHTTGQEERSSSMNRHPSLALTEGFTTPQPLRLESWLTPRVSITPEVTALEKGCHMLWAAIEISTRPWPPPKKTVQPGATDESLESDGLYDLSVQILPTEESSVIRVLQERAFPIRYLEPGSSVFLLAQIQVHVARGVQNNRQVWPRYESDNLIEALEEELGDSVVNYMRVRLSYRHSAFPMGKDIGIPDDEMFSIHNKIVTVATASVKLHNALSLWSPPPASSSNPLLPLAERHWGVANARRDVCRGKFGSQFCPSDTPEKGKSSARSQRGRA